MSDLTRRYPLATSFPIVWPTGVLTVVGMGAALEYLGLIWFLGIVLTLALASAGLAMKVLAMTPKAVDPVETRAMEESRRAVFAMMSHLTPADERWLAERHHYVVPKEVARIRAGLPWNEPFNSRDHNYRYPIPITNRLELVKKAEAAQKVFNGDALHESERPPARKVTKPVEGEWIEPMRGPGRSR
jgi:hypothetical protein